LQIQLGDGPNKAVMLTPARTLSALLCLWTLTDASKSKYSVQSDQDTVDDQTDQLELMSFSKDTDSFVIGGVFALSNNGTNTANLVGMQRSIAFECAVALVNAQKVSGMTHFYYQLQDDGNTTPFAVRGAIQALEGGVPALVGPESSDQMLSSAPVYGSYGLPIMGPASTSDALSDSLTYPSFFRMVPGDAAEAQAIAAVCVYFNWSLITPIYTTDAYGTSGSLAFSAAANANRISFTCGRSIAPGTVQGITSTNSCLSSSFSNIVLLYMSSSDAGNVLTAMYNSTSNQRLTFLASDAWADILDFSAFSLGRFPSSFIEGTLGFVPQIGDQQPYVDCASAYQPGNNDLPYFNQFWEQTFHCSLDPNSQLPGCPTGQSYQNRNVNNIACQCNGEENLSQVPPDVLQTSISYLSSIIHSSTTIEGHVYRQRWPMCLTR
jgi:ABC-type branched-subunit amino acid transport system substrate-binding protein